MSGPTERDRRRLLRRRYPAQRLFSRNPVANGLTLGLVAVDFVTLYTMWNLYLLESPWTLCLLAGGFACILDVPMAMAGCAFKQYRQGLRPRADAWLILIVSSLAFLVVFVLSFCFRLVIRDLTFGAGSAGGLVSMMGTAQPLPQQDRGQLFAALTLASLPLATSLSAFSVTFMVSDPRQERMMLLQSQRVTLQTWITALEGELAQLGDPDDVFAADLAAENARCQAFRDRTDAQARVLKEQARLELLKHKIKE